MDFRHKVGLFDFSVILCVVRVPKPNCSRIFSLPGFHLLGYNASHLLVSCEAYSLTLKIEATCSSETSVYFQRTTWCYVLEDRTLHNHRYEDLKSYVKGKAIHVTGCGGP
jgi:hypothetical protein